MAIAANMRDLVDRPYALDLEDADVLDGSNVLKLPNNRHSFKFVLSGNKTIASISTQLREGRVIRFLNDTAGLLTVTITDNASSTQVEGQVALAVGALGTGDNVSLQQMSSGHWVQVGGTDGN